MGNTIYTPLQLREIFHLEFLRWLGRKIKARHYAVKGGVNLRLFYQSLRYSEDMDLDAAGIKVEILKETVMQILKAQSFQNTLVPFGVERIVAPDITRAKQTATTQRFKIHILTDTGEDLFTKIEFSRRGIKGNISVEAVSNTVLRPYKLPPLLVPHYDIHSAITQKLSALATRTLTQARDIFDLFILHTQCEISKREKMLITGEALAKAYENMCTVSFEQFRDSVVSYLSPEDQMLYNSAHLWDEIKLKVANLIKQLQSKNG